MRYLYAVSLLLFVALFVHAQDEFKLSVDTGAVSLEAIVKDANGRPQVQLGQSDFEIYEDGQPQEIRFFGAAETPRSVMLVFDITGVMESQGPFMVKAINVFLANLREQDRVAIGTIGPQFDPILSFRKIEKNKPTNIKMPPSAIGSNIYESLNMAAKRFDKEQGRKVLIALTDGRDTTMFNETKRLGRVPDLSIDLDFKKWMSEAPKRGVPYHIIALDTDPRYMTGPDYEYAFFKNPDGYRRDPQYGNGSRNPNIAEEYLAGVKLRMEKLAELTGGRVIYAKSIQDVAALYSQIALEFGYSYSLGYVPKSSANDGKFHRIEVRTKDKSFKVEQSREGFGTPELKAK